MCNSISDGSPLLMMAYPISEIDGIKIIQTKLVSDVRGTFIKFDPLRSTEGAPESIAVSLNPNLGTIRGLHFQIEPFGEEKLITCIQGSIFDVAVDLRPNSGTFGRWASIELSAINALQVYLPKGIAHGFQTLLPNSIVHYSLGSIYSPESSYVIDPFGDLDINWPLKAGSISDRDAAGIPFSLAGQKYAESLEI